MNNINVVSNIPDNYKKVYELYFRKLTEDICWNYIRVEFDTKDETPF